MNDKLRCPACGAVALSTNRKTFTSELFPARCRNCRALVAAKRTWSTALIDTILVHVLYVGGAVVSFLSRSWWPLIVAVACDIVLVQLMLGSRLPLILLTPDRVSRWRRNASIGIVIFIVLVILAGVTDR